ncbi:hypothetical protein [Nocardiopsis sp. CNR-923]|uniref:hypothetical protein n=1 Tax=Nocardiopsis sp. CNR-923 TaxID=1904965 RepID=UPI0021CC681B|nr:hypothetical protein [Nocardiopsis sp. CNR-923]
MTMHLLDASAVATHVADRLATPDQGRALANDRWWPQSLAHGAVGVALLHIERARTGHGPWERVQTWLECAISDGVDASPEAHLYYGAPALAFVLRQAATVHPAMSVNWNSSTPPWPGSWPHAWRGHTRAWTPGSAFRCWPSSTPSAD